MPIERDGRVLALVVHDTTVVDSASLDRQIGSAARIAIENEQLRAEVLAQIDDLRASQARIVERGDTERRRLERDLHDGAQQQLLALSYDLRRAHATAAKDGHREAAAILASSVDETLAALEELRELARGIYPAILTESGLEAALRGLVDTAPLVVELGSVTHERFPAQVEIAAYVTVAETIADAETRGATLVTASSARVDDVLHLEIEDDGRRRGAGLTQIADRVGALGGTIRFEPRAVRVEMPCV